MAVGETMTTVVGNVCGDLSRRRLSNGDEVTSFWLRSNERRFDKRSGTWTDGRHFSVRVNCWRRLATTVGNSLTRGDPVVVRGRLYTSEYAVEGSRRAVPELEAIAIGPNLAWCTATVTPVSRGPSPSDAMDSPGNSGAEAGVKDPTAEESPGRQRAPV